MIKFYGIITKHLAQLRAHRAYYPHKKGGNSLTDISCYRTLRIRIPQLNEDAEGEFWEALLPMVEGVVSVRASTASSRLKIQYDDRQITAWQISALIDRIKGRDDRHASLLAYKVHRHKMFMLLPVSLSIALLVRRYLLGRSVWADNFVIFELSTILSAFSGYPGLRSRVAAFSKQIGVNDDTFLSMSALGLAFLRESHSVFAMLFWLSFNAYKKRNNTLSASLKAGERVALLDQDNIEPARVTAYAKNTSRLIFPLAFGTLVITRNPRIASALLLAGNPRPVLLSAKYLLNHGEVTTHENCQFIPMQTGMDLFDLADVQTVMYIREKGDERIAHFCALQRKAITPLRQVILCDPAIPMLPIHQRQGDTLLLQGTMKQWQQTYQLSHLMHEKMRWLLKNTFLFNTTAVVCTFLGAADKKVNLASDIFSLLMLSQADGFFETK